MNVERRALGPPTAADRDSTPALSMMERMALHQVATHRRLTVGKTITHALCVRGLLAERGDRHIVTPAGFRALAEDAVLAKPGASALSSVHPNESPPRSNPFGSPRR
jgi:hypothetical protein